MIQQGQVFKLQATCMDGEPLWAYRYRLAGRGSGKGRMGGPAARRQAQRALQKKVAAAAPCSIAGP